MVESDRFQAPLQLPHSLLSGVQFSLESAESDPLLREALGQVGQQLFCVRRGARAEELLW